MHEASKAATLEDKQRFLDTLKSNGDKIKSVMGEFLKNTWAQRISQIEQEKQKAAIEHKKKVIAVQASKDEHQIKAIEKEYKAKMDDLNRQIAE